ncbi:MAG: hypothetical protein L3J33_03280 [Rhodobacteraceae bacterium]|nr:hypothetical protein [Paracoccaceae bacterium]
MTSLDTFAKEQLIIQKELFFGWGVEDIAFRNNLTLAEIRKEIERLRALGELHEVLGINSKPIWSVCSRREVIA